MDRKKAYATVYALMLKAGVRQHKEALLEGYGVSSLKDLTDSEVNDLIDRLQEMLVAKGAKVPETTRKLRSTVLQAASNYFGRAIGDTASWDAFNTLMMNPRIMGKMMWAMSDEELKAVNTKLRAITKKKETTKATENRLAVLN